ncbi:hypothetical protein EDD11_005478 [Mortierella claussenii]|nr:hypothetical protein EDD11_005478 [Mortierella claussenii]
MEDIVLHVQTEVALDGDSGSSWSRFWFLVDQCFQASKTFTIAEPTSSTRASSSSSSQAPTSEPIKRMDEKLRVFFWNNFIHEDGVLFYEHRPANANGASITSSKDLDDSKASFVPFSELVPLNESELSYKDVMEKYKDTIRIVGTVEQQRCALLGYSGAGVQVSGQAFIVLQTITAAREIGVTQAQLAKQHKLDSRSIFHSVKTLIEMKLIVKIPVTTGGQYTLLCLHKQYASKNPGYMAMTSKDNHASAGKMFVASDNGRRFEGLLKNDNKKVSYYSGLIKQKLTDILGRAKNQAMSIEDLAKALDLTDMNSVQNRWFNRQIELLCKLKYIKRIQVPGIYRCIQLLRPYGTDITMEEGDREQLNLKSVIADDIPLSGICFETSIEHQVYKHVMDAKERGIIAKEIRQKMNMLNSKLLNRILETLTKPPSPERNALIRRVGEFVGRERRYRYYSDEGFQKSVAKDHKEYIEKSKSFPVTVLPPRIGGKKQSGAASVSNDASPTVVISGSNSSADQAASTSSTSESLTEPSNVAAESDTTGTLGTSGIQSAGSSPASTGAGPSSVRAAPELLQSATPERFISVALLKRRKVILSIVERRRMTELHQSLVTEYQQEKLRLYPGEDETSVIDRKTLYRTISILEAEGLIQLYKVENIPTAGGNLTSKTFCLHHSVDPESDELKEFVKECSNRNLLFGSLAVKPAKKAEKLDVEVETLDEMQQRLGKEFFKGPSVPFSDLGPSKTKAESKPRNTRGHEFEGFENAIEYGWNRAKMMRALVFHRFLLDKLGSADGTLFIHPTNRHVLSTPLLFNVLHLRVFLIVVGQIPTPTDEMRAFLDANRKSTMPLRDVPPFMKESVAPNKNFKKRLIEVLEVLDALGLITPLSSVPNSGNATELQHATNHLVLNTHYEVHVNVRAPLDPHEPDQLEKDLEDRKEYMLLSAKECRDFWMDLQASSSVMKYVSVERSLHRPWSEIRQAFLLNLCNKRLWAEPIRVSPSQTRILMTQVNTKIRFAPHANDPRVDQMAKETGLPRDHVVQYYKAVLAVWHAHPEGTNPARTRRLTQVRRTRKAVDRNQEKAISSTVTAEPQDDATSDMAPATPISLDRGAFGAPAVNEPAQRFAVGAPKRRRARRMNWEDADDERLMLGAAIVRCLSDTFNTKFSWQCITNSFNQERNRSVCRHRYSKLMKEATLAKQVQSYRAQFNHVLPGMVEKFNITRKLDDFDPSPLLEFFRPSVDTPIPHAINTSPLHINPADIERLNLVRQNERCASLYLEERLHPDLSLPRRLQLINQLPPTLRLSSTRELDGSPEDLSAPRTVLSHRRSVGKGAHHEAIIVRDEKLGVEHTILAVVKAIYCLPPGKRPRSVIREILSSFMSSKVLETCELAKEWKILTSIRNASYRIPGQRVGRSERFWSLMNGAYPRRLTAAAAAIDSTWSRTLEHTFQMDAGFAEMMVLLNDFGMGYLQLSMVQPVDEKQTAAYEEPYAQGALLGFDVRLENLRAKADPVPLTSTERMDLLKAQADSQEEEEQTTDIVSTEDQSDQERTHSTTSHGKAKIKEETVWEKARHLAATAFDHVLAKVTTDKLKALYKAVYDSVFGSCTIGMTPQDIKDTLKTQRLQYTDKEIIECLDCLVQGSQAVLVKVGMAHVRYVGFGWHQTWTVNYRCTTEREEEIQNTLGWRVPRMWHTLDGQLEKTIFETSLHSILTNVADKPGISKGSLLKHYQKLILAVELEELIDELERRGAIEARYGLLPVGVSLFSKRGQFERCDRYTIDERKVTNYFARPAYYTYLNMELVAPTRPGMNTMQSEEQFGMEGENDAEEEEECEEDNNGYKETNTARAYMAEEPATKKLRSQ